MICRNRRYWCTFSLGLRFGTLVSHSFPETLRITTIFKTQGINSKGIGGVFITREIVRTGTQNLREMGETHGDRGFIYFRFELSFS